MLDDDFKKIEDFLKNAGNSEEEFLKLGDNTEIQTFQDFEKIVHNFITDKLKDNTKENFTRLNEVLYHSNLEFNHNITDVIKDFSITIVLLKQLLTIIQSTQDDIILNEEDKKMYISLMKILISILKDDVKSNSKFFEIFSEYLDGIDNLFSF